MGYYTKFGLMARPWPDELTDYLLDHEDRFYGIDCGGSSLDECKWYGHEEDMRKLSLEFPDIHFTLHGEGEESGDIWEKHFVKGKMQCCPATITFPTFDLAKLE